MLTESNQLEVNAKIKELADLLKEQGILSRINIVGGNKRGDIVLRMEADGGYWKSSTSECMGEYGPPEIYLELENNETWTASNSWQSSNC